MPTPPDAPYKLKQRKLSAHDIAAMSGAAAKLGGCTCDPEVRIREVSGDVFAVDIAHDAWCEHRSQRERNK